jgi:N-acetylglucosaminyldiphosphoundecaprenol N-acetyl-beta-D-mannosaminyltransferase
MKKIDFLGIPVNALTMEETIKRIDDAIQENRHINQSSINAGKVVAMLKSKELFKSIVSSDIINADGQSIIWAARLLREELPERVAGCDLMQKLVELAYERKYKCFFFGAKEEVVKKVVGTYINKYNEEIIVGYRNGYFTKEEEPAIANQIVISGANMLFVALTSPNKENFLFNYQNILKPVNFTMGVGGSFDIIAGVTKRAPRWMQKYGLEWFYRFLQEPGRMWRRYLIGNSQFIWIVVKERIKLLKTQLTELNSIIIHF